MSFLVALRLWHDFYMGMCIASAALLGLVFLGLSLSSGHVNGHGGTGPLEGQTLGFLLGLLIVSFLVLIPDQTPRSLGCALLAAGILGLASVARTLWRETRGRPKSADPSFIAWRIALPLAVLLGTAVAAVLMMGRGRNNGMEGLYLLSASLLALVLNIARNTWELLGRAAPQERLKLHREKQNLTGASQAR
jgi:hypothetical protein